LGAFLAAMYPNNHPCVNLPKSSMLGKVVIWLSAKDLQVITNI
jgi:hypothetical protein